MKIFTHLGIEQASTSAKHEPSKTQKPSFKAANPERISRAKRAFVTRRVDLGLAKKLLTQGVRPKCGDLLMARVKRLGQHGRIELPSGRRAHMFVGDEIIVCYGNRYATDQFEALIPDHLGPCNLVAAGGIASVAISKAANMKRATDIEPIGLLCDGDGAVLNLSRFGVDTPPQLSVPRPLILAVVGTAMNAGKTTAACDIIRGLSANGLRVSSAKITGTGAGGDIWHFIDSGAYEAVDFTDAGLASTYMTDLPQLHTTTQLLVNHLGRKKPDVIVLEIADGLMQRETKPLLSSAIFKAMVDGLFFAASDAMGAMAGSQWLLEQGLPLVALCGMLGKSDINAQEAHDATGLPVLSRATLSDGAIITPLVFKARPKSNGGKL